ncbi:hypothetical protein [uncultured Bacteroides sp.]|uniref:hypothetical protein n=1 Tax=uncultured Bacteroides sp. TaxID=162156 RepID=UPI002AAA886B|nr:hypothetical protein [uncultured Bacteroides sp.]
MKKNLLLLLLLVSSFALGQNSGELKEIRNVNFYGVDYSLAKVYGAVETPEQFKKMFGDINTLFISEARKYDVAKLLKKDVDKIELDVVNQMNTQLNLNGIMANSKKYVLDSNLLSEHIKSLPIKDEKGVGLIVVAQLLDKASNQGTYQVVYFDLSSRKILSSSSVQGKAGGFGLRNFWASSMYKALKKADKCFYNKN